MRDDRFHLGSGALGSDARSNAARDRDRLLYSEPFRRLLGVTQVVGAHEAIFHNRLTHSLKVAQISRRLTETVSRQFPGPDGEKKLMELGGLDPEVAEAAALAHDLGHPPFGHAGEIMLDELVRNHGCSEGFEGNAQSFRIVNKLAFRKPDPTNPPGLNLTRATLRAVLKYPWEREFQEDGNPVTSKRGRKWGSYSTESGEFQFAMELPPKDESSRSLEAEIMDWADDITYAVHDLEDFFRAGLIPIPTLLTNESALEEFITSAAARIPLKESEVRGTFKRVSVFLPTQPFNGAPRQLGQLAVLRNQLITLMIDAFKVTSKRKTRVSIDREERNLAEVLKQLTWEYVILTPNLASQQFGQRKVIAEIFDAYCTTHANGNTKLPEEYLRSGFVGELIADGSTPPRHAADFIASLTEAQALHLYGRLTGHRLGSIRDLLTY